jgi:hypothetical protein
MLQTALKLMSAIKGYLIAFALFVFGLFAAVLVGREKQKTKDTVAATQIVNQELNRIQETATHVQTDVQKLSPSGPTSAAQQLRDDWSDH